MPRNNVGSTDVFNVACGGDAITVKARNGGPLSVRLDGDRLSEDVAVTIEVSDDNAVYTAHAKSGQAVTVKGVVDLNLVLRDGVDNYVRMSANGEGVLGVQIHQFNTVEVLR